MAIRAAESKHYKGKIAIAFGRTVRHVSIGEAFSLATSLLFIAWSMIAIRLALAERKPRGCRNCTPMRRIPKIRMRH